MIADIDGEPTSIMVIDALHFGHFTRRAIERAKAMKTSRRLKNVIRHFSSCQL